MELGLKREQLSLNLLVDLQDHPWRPVFYGVHSSLGHLSIGLALAAVYLTKTLHNPSDQVETVFYLYFGCYEPSFFTSCCSEPFLFTSFSEPAALMGNVCELWSRHLDRLQSPFPDRLPVQQGGERNSELIFNFI